MIAVSIVVYNTPLDELSVCLGCLAACDIIKCIEIVDNSRNARIEKFLSDNFPHVVYTPSPNIGYGAANNISIRKSIANGIKYHLVMNSDIDFAQGVIEGLVMKMERDSEIGLIMPAVVNTDGTPQSCCHPLPSPLDLLKHRFTKKHRLSKWRSLYDLYPQKIGRDINVPYMHGCFMLFRVDALVKVGLFDERYFMYPEDIDITRRVHAEYGTIVTPDFTIYHRHRAESRHSMKMLYIHATNMLKYFYKWGFVFDSQRRQFNRRLRNSLNN